MGPPRPDGFHELTTVYQAVGLYDDLVLRRARGVSVEVRGEGADAVPTDGSNLAVRAAHLLAEATGHPPEVAITVSKTIPVAGGCAGGSADAAAALLGCDALWGTGLRREELAELAARLGSDVPFSLQGATALGTGRGEQLAPVLTRGTFSWVLAVADGGLSTPAVYAELDRLRATQAPRVASGNAAVLAALRSGDTAALGRALSNDLQAAALSLRPDLARLLAAAAELGAVAALVSGSGPTVALLTRDGDQADGLVAALAGRDLCRRVLRADGPVPGARLVEVT